MLTNLNFWILSYKNKSFRNAFDVTNLKHMNIFKKRGNAATVASS